MSYKDSMTFQKVVTQGADKSEVFESTWKNHGFDGAVQEAGTKTTVPLQRVVGTDSEEEEKQALKFLEEKTGEWQKGKVKRTAATLNTGGIEAKVVKDEGQMETKTMDIGEVDNFTPLVFDPEIVSILQKKAPVLDLIPQEGQEGFSAVYNIVDQRDDPLGYLSEADAVDLSNNSASDVGFAKDEVDMTRYVDKVTISDFTQAAASHYMNVEDTTLGEKVGQHARRKAQQIFYGDPTQDTQTGFIGDAEGFKGLTGFASDAGNVIDKSGTSSNFIKDIKDEIRQMQQDEAVDKDNLVIVTSHEFFDVLENEADFDNLRTDPSDRTVNVGLNQLQIASVPVIPSSNIDSYTDTGNGTTYNAGDPGDVFIMSSRTARFRALMPLTMVPLAKNGLSESVALAEFGALVEKSQGNFVRHLQAYAI